MFISGQHDFYFNAQKNVSFSSSINLNRASGDTIFSINGISGGINFHFKNGRVIDNNNNFVWSYRSGDIINLSGDLSQTHLTYWINGNPICVSEVAPNYYSGASLSVASGAVCDFSNKMMGKLPQHSFIYPDNLLSGESLPVLFINNNEDPNEFFSVISGNMDYLPSSIYKYFSLSGIDGGTRTKISGGGGDSLSFSFDPTGNFVGPFSVPFSLFTDFGQLAKNFTVNYTTTPTYFQSYTNTFSGLLFDVNSGENFYHYRSVLFLLNSGVNEDLYTYLYDGGDNNYNVTGTYRVRGSVSGLVSGYMVESGSFSGLLSGTLYTIQDFSGQSINPYYTEVSGITGVYATGCIPSGSVYGWGLLYPGSTGYYPSYFSQDASGYLMGNLSGYVSGGSGILTGYATGNITGVRVLIFSGNSYDQYPAPSNYPGFSTVYYGPDAINTKVVSGIYTVPYTTTGANGFYDLTGHNFLRNQRISGNLTGYAIWGSGNKDDAFNYNGPSFCIGSGSGKMVVTTGQNLAFLGSESSSTIKYPTNYYGWPTGIGFTGEIYSGLNGSTDGWTFNGRVNPYTYINSGFYTILIQSGGYTVTGVTGVIYADSFEKSWGLDINSLSGVSYDGIDDRFEYNVFMNSGSNYKTITFDFFKRVSLNQQNLLSGSSIYVISGNNNLLYSGEIIYG
jgi:hypothetical protein